MKYLLFPAVLLSVTLLLLSGCSSTGSYSSGEQQRSVFYGEVTSKCIDYEGVERNPVIVVHGFLGSRFIDSETGENLWGDFSWMDELFGASDKRVLGMSHPMGYKKPLRELKNNTIPENILEIATVKWFGITIKLAAYKNLIDALVRVGFQAEGRPLIKGKSFNSLFDFAYDWRRDLPENAEKFNQFIEEKRKYIQQQYKILYGIDNFDVKFDIIGHSMGGLLARYYLRYGAQDLPQDGSLPKLDWYGSKNIDHLIVAGAPNAGYLDTFIEMVEGAYLQPLPLASLGTFPSYYQMLPTPHVKSIIYSDNNEQVNVFDPEVWKKMKWGLMNPEEDKTLKILLPDIKTKEERSLIAYDHLSKCLKRAKQFIEAMSVKADPPEKVLLFSVFGRGFKTSRRAFINRKTGKIERVEYSSGDGKVLVSSAVWDERVGGKWSFFLRSPIDWDYLLSLRAAHMGILKTPVFEDNILLLLSMIETKKKKKILDGIACSIVPEPLTKKKKEVLDKASETKK